MKNPKLIAANGIPLSFNFLYDATKCTVMAILDAVEDSTTREELLANLNSLGLYYKFYFDRETPAYVRLRVTDRNGNKWFFKAEK